LGGTLSVPFPFTQATKSLTELDPQSRGDEFPGLLEFCHQGCGNYSYLVTKGAAYGTVWDGRPEDDDFRPTGLSFYVWYRRWAEGALRALENERFLPRLRAGMTEAEVLMEVGGNWKKRKAAS
jgi:hypothetical protein